MEMTDRLDLPVTAASAEAVADYRRARPAAGGQPITPDP
jgi:hypothetical protein